MIPKIYPCRIHRALVSRPIWLILVLLLLNLAVVPAQAVPSYETGFGPSDNFTEGSLNGQNGWLVTQGNALITGDAVVLESGSPRAEIAKTFTQFNGEDTVFIAYRMYGAAGEPPSNAPESSSPNVFHVALAAEGGFARLYVFDGDGSGNGVWTPTQGKSPIDSSGNLLDWVEVTIRIDFNRKVFDLYLNNGIVGFGYGFLDSEQEAFSQFRFRGNPTSTVFFDDFYAGISPQGWINQSGDGLDDSWKTAHGLSLGGDIRDLDVDADGLSNIEEFFLGTNPMLADTSRDGLSDSQAVDLSVNPLASSNYFPVTLPFFDGFEGWPLGNIDARGGWRVLENGLAEVWEIPFFQGEQMLRLIAENATVGAEIEIAENSEPIVWTDLYLQPAAHIRKAPPAISSDAAVAFYFDGEGRVIARDGATDDWLAFEPPLFSSESDWTRVTIQQDFMSQTWSFWLNSVKVAEELGFSAASSSYKNLLIKQHASTSSLDKVFIGIEEPAFLDNDGDGLFNSEEIALGSDPNSPDTSGDGMWDGDKVLWGFDPAIFGNYALPSVGENERSVWRTAFSQAEGYGPDGLDGQEDWMATAGVEIAVEESYTAGQAAIVPASVDAPETALRYFGMENGKTVWVTARLCMQPGSLPNASGIEGSRSAIVAVGSTGYLFCWDGLENRWVNTGFQTTEGTWVRLNIGLDYTDQRWKLCVDGVLVLQDLGFRDTDLRTFTRFAISGATTESSLPTVIDTLAAELQEPEGLDFSGDGMTNDEKRALGLDIYKVDTNGDGLPDWWLVAHGLNALDPEIADSDPDGDGLIVRDEYDLGTNPNNSDTDGDGWSDLDEYLAGTDALDGASAPDAAGLGDWTVARVGNGQDAHAFRVGDEYRLLGSGLGTAQSEDGFTFAYRQVTGNFEAVAKIRAPEHLEFGGSEVPSWLSQNGLMARSTLEEDTSYSAVFTSPLWYWSRFRELPGGRAVGLTHEPVLVGGAKFVRLRRVGNRFSHYLSDDGETWFLFSDVTVIMPEEILVGMFASAHENDLWVRARLTDVEIVELVGQVEWYEDDGEGGATFDSFAWMGEWDGKSDYDDVAIALRQPTLEELAEAGLQAPIALELSGFEAVETLGDWEANDGSLVCLDRRGWIEFDLEVADPDIYLIELKGREGNPFLQSGSSFDLKFYLEDEYLGTRILEATVDESGNVLLFSPWLDAGTHRLRILWDGARSRTHLKVDAVQLRIIEGPSASGSRIKYWVKDRLTLQSGITPELPAFTYVSPLPLEGRDRFNSLMKIQVQPRLNTPTGQLKKFSRPFAAHPRGETGMDFEPERDQLSQTGNPISVSEAPHFLPNHPVQWNQYISTWSNPVSFPSQTGPGYRFWSDVPLAPLVDNALTLSWQNGIAEQRHMVRWIPYNVLEGGSMVLRVGDSLLMTAHEGNQQSGAIFLDIGEETFETEPGSPLVYTFSEPGNYIVHGNYVRPNGAQFSGTLQVSVRGFDFPVRPLAYVGRQRNWDTREESGASSLFDADPRLRLQTNPDGSLKFDSEDNDFRTIVARSTDDGSVLDSIEVESFRLFSTWETYSEVVDTLPDRTKLVETMMILSPVPQDVRVKIRITVGGILFDDGSIERWLSFEDFDDLGQITFRFIMPKEAVTSVCHRTYIYQGNLLIGER